MPKRRRQDVVDFKHRRAKVGKKLKPANATSTAFRHRGLVLREQAALERATDARERASAKESAIRQAQVLGEGGGAESGGGDGGEGGGAGGQGTAAAVAAARASAARVEAQAALALALASTEHYAAPTRKDALWKVKDLAVRHPDVVLSDENAGGVLSALASHFADADGEVRLAVAAALEAVTVSGPSRRAAAQFPVLLISPVMCADTLLARAARHRRGFLPPRMRRSPNCTSCTSAPR